MAAIEADERDEGGEEDAMAADAAEQLVGDDGVRKPSLDRRK
jgi:hypothetical protein